MRFIAYNIVAIMLVLLTGFMIYNDKPSWGWVLFAALLVTVFPGNNKSEF